MAKGLLQSECIKEGRETGTDLERDRKKGGILTLEGPPGARF